MTIRAKPGDHRDLAETLLRYFEARLIPLDLDGHANGSLLIRFHAEGRDASVTVSFDDAAYDAFTHSDTDHQRRALTRIAGEFTQPMERREPVALAGDFRIHRF